MAQTSTLAERKPKRAAAQGRLAELRDGLSVLADPDGAEFRAMLRSLLASLLADPGRLVSPVYVGPLPRPDLLQAEVEAAAQAAGVPMLARHEVGVRAGAQRGVALLSERDASLITQYGVNVAEGVQVVVWGRMEPHELSPTLQEWIAQGIALDPQHDTLRGASRPIGDAVARITDPGAVRRRCLVWTGGPETLGQRAAEARVRLELAGGAAEALVVSLPGGAGPAGAARVWAQARARLDAGAATVVVTDPQGAGSLRLLDVTGPQPDEAIWIHEGGAVEPAEWPPLEVALAGVPKEACDRSELITFPLRTVPMVEVLRAPALERRAGTLVVFEQHRLGWVRFAVGEIRDARRVQEDRAAGTATELVARIRDMARWPNARAVFVPRGPTDREDPAGGCRIALEAVAFDLFSLGTGSTGFASREQGPDQVAEGLLEWGLRQEAQSVLQTAVRGKELGPRGAFLLGHLYAESDPRAAADLFRLAVRLTLAGRSPGADPELALDAGLNALLLEVRADLRPAAAAWGLVEQAGLAGPAVLGDSPARARVAAELAARAGRDPVPAPLEGGIDVAG